MAEAPTDQRAIIGGPVLDVVLCLVRGMDSRLHPSSLVCPLATSLRIRAPTRVPGKPGQGGQDAVIVIFETLFETLWVSNPIRPRSATSRNRVMRGPGVTQGAKRSQGVRRPRD